MSYIGRQISNLSDRVKLDSITTSATATYNLLLNTVAYVPSSAESLTVSLNGVIQAPQDSYTVSGSQITFASALTSSDSIDFILAERSITLTSVSAGSVGTSQLASDAVNGDKIADDSISDEHLDITAITGQTEKTSLADADKFLISDSAASGALKYVQKSNLPSGGLQFIAAQNTSVTSVITFSNCFSSTYKNYAIFFTNINFSSDSDLGFRFGASGTYLEDYKGASHGYESGQVGTAYNSGQTYAKPAGALFGVDTAANSQQGMTGSGIIYMPYDSTSAVYGTFQVGCRNEANSQWVIANSWFTSNTDASYTDLRAYSTSSNDFNTHGRIAIYGIVDS